MRHLVVWGVSLKLKCKKSVFLCFVFFIFKFPSVIVLSQRFHKLYAPTVFFSFGQFPHHLPPSNSALCLLPLNLVSVPASAFFYIHIIAVEPDVGFSFVNLQNIWTWSYTIQNQESVGLLAHCFDLMYQFTDHWRWIPPEYGHLFVSYASAYLDIHFLPHLIAAQTEQLRSWPPNIVSLLDPHVCVCFFSDWAVSLWILAGRAAGVLAGRHYAVAHLPSHLPLPDEWKPQPVLQNLHPAAGNAHNSSWMQRVVWTRKLENWPENVWQRIFWLCST